MSFDIVDMLINELVFQSKRNRALKINCGIPTHKCDHTYYYIYLNKLA